MEEFNLCDAFGWSWDACRQAPSDVREVFGLILEARGAAQQLKAQELERQAAKR